MAAEPSDLSPWYEEPRPLIGYTTNTVHRERINDNGLFVMSELRDYTLGLDLGPNSIGWALVETEFDDRNEPVAHRGFLDCTAAGHPPMGVRVFEEGIANLGTSKEKPRAQERRINRSARRIHARRSARKRRLREVLTQAGFFPETEEALQTLMAQSDPYELRARGLDEALTADEVGRALFHLCQRRGFKSNRKSGSSNEDRGMLKEIAELQADIDGSGARTLGEYLHRLAVAETEQLQSGDVRLRNRHTRRSMIERELRLLLDAQRPHHPGLAAIEGKVTHAILHQHDFLVTEERRAKAPSRANLHRSPTVRACLLEPDERCAPRSAWVFQQFRLLKEVHNLRTLDEGGDWRELT
ncbi:hypothetical protein N9L45_01465 [Planctomycetota bacterium]|nr:hypothetical protein [Planctomycetota bacterium]